MLEMCSFVVKVDKIKLKFYIFVYFCEVDIPVEVVEEVVVEDVVVGSLQSSVDESAGSKYRYAYIHICKTFIT